MLGLKTKYLNMLDAQQQKKAIAAQTLDPPI